MRPNITRIDPSELATLQEKIKFKATDFNRTQVLKGKIFQEKGGGLTDKVKEEFVSLQGLMHCEKKEDEEPNDFQARFIEEFKRLFELQDSALVQKADFTRPEEADVEKIPAEAEEILEEELQQPKETEELRRQADEASKHKTEQEQQIEIFQQQFSTKIDVAKFRRNLLERIKQTDLKQLQNKQQIAILLKALKILHKSQNQVLDLMALCDRLDAFEEANPQQFHYDETTSFIGMYGSITDSARRRAEFEKLSESGKIDSFIQDIQWMFNDILNQAVEESYKKQLLNLVGGYFASGTPAILEWNKQTINHRIPCDGFKTIKSQQRQYGIAWSEDVESIRTDILSLYEDHKAVLEAIAGVESSNFGLLLDSEKIKKTDRKTFFTSLGEYLGDNRFKIIKDKVEESAKANSPLTDADIPTIRTLIIEAFGGGLKDFIQEINSSDNGINLADLLGIDLALVSELQDSIQDKSTIEDFVRFKGEQEFKEQEIKRKIVRFRNRMNIHRKFSDAVAVNTSETMDSVLSRYAAAAASSGKDYNSELETIVLGSMEAVRDVDGTHQVESDGDELLESAIKTLDGIINPQSTTSSQTSKTVKFKKLSEEEKQELSNKKEQKQKSQEAIREVKIFCATRISEFQEAVTLKKEELENLKEIREALRANWGIANVEDEMLRYMAVVRQNISTLQGLKAKMNQLLLDKAKKAKKGITSNVDEEEAQKVKEAIASIISGERVDLNEDVSRKKVTTISASSQTDRLQPPVVVSQMEFFRVDNGNYEIPLSSNVPPSSILPVEHFQIGEEVFELPALSLVDKINTASDGQGSVEKYEEDFNPSKSAVVQEDEIRIIDTASRELKPEKLSIGANTARLMNERKFTITSVSKPINSDETGYIFSEVLFHLIDEAAKSAKIFKKDSKEIDHETVAKIIMIAGASGGVSGEKAKSKFEKNFREAFPQSEQSGENLLLDKAKRFSHKFQELSKEHALYTGNDLSDEKTAVVGARLKRISPEMVKKYCIKNTVDFRVLGASSSYRGR